MKKGLAFIFVFSLLFSLCACALPQGEGERERTQQACINYADDLKGVWLTYYEIGDIFKNLSQAEAREKLGELFSSLAKKGINTVFFHVRAFADAFYPSDFFPRSAYCSPDYDLLDLAIEEAHAKKLSFHAWINPYRVALGKDLSALEADSPAVKLYEKDHQNLLLGKDFIFFNPAAADVQRLIVDGVRELLAHYAPDGIQFDDYFYPGTAKSLDKASFHAYRKAGGTLELADYRRESVSNLIAAVSLAVKAQNENILFGVSPQASVEKNRETLFADVLRWMENGYLDYIMPQIYFGFNNETSPFEKTLLDWIALAENTPTVLYCGLAQYKAGKTDEYASADTESADSPYYEWVNDTQIIQKQIALLQRQGVKGYALFSFSDLE